MELELVIFDLDGVIVSTDQFHYNAWNSLAKEHNLTFSYEVNHRFRSVSRAECLKILLEKKWTNREFYKVCGDAERKKTAFSL
ncbi:MAG: HAD hydrolase-like protein [Promethearchaeota archaeon]